MSVQDAALPVAAGRLQLVRAVITGYLLDKFFGPMSLSASCAGSAAGILVVASASTAHAAYLPPRSLESVWGGS